MLGKSLIRPFSSLKDRLSQLLPQAQARMLHLRKSKGDLELGKITVDQVIGGMRGMVGLVTETSKLDAKLGIRFRGLSIAECREKLPKKAVEPLPEAMLYLLLTGEIPTHEQTEEVRKDLATRSPIPEPVERLMFSLPTAMHPMTQLGIGVMALQPDSQFFRKYREGLSKADYWKATYEDALNLIAKIPRLAAIIYRRTYKDGSISPINQELDLSANFAHMLGYNDEGFNELMRLYMVIHCDHEGGNVSAHATHLIGSALSDPYLAYTAGLNGLAGPLHGLANQEFLKFLLDLQAKMGENPTENDVETYVQRLLKSGQVVPGFGHAVLRVTDPRFTCQQEFASRIMPNDKLCRLVQLCYEVIPRVLAATGKVKNPWPNVDAHSGALLYHYGLREFDFYTVLFGVSRAIGTMSSLVLSRGLGLPIERPESVTLDLLEAATKAN
jgi:citrate synthase